MQHPDTSFLQSYIGKTLGHYRLVKCLGAGGVGAVFLGEYARIESLVAIKILLPRFIANQEMVRRFLDEARAVNRIIHPGLVRIHDIGTHEELGKFLVMEYLRGETLMERIKEAGSLPVATAVNFARQAASALEAAHAAGIIHRDMKPSNIFLCPDAEMPGGERVKLLDFGVAKLTQDDAMDGMTRTGTVFGSPHYMSPEQCVDAKNVDLRTDIYSLAVIAYAMLTRNMPFEARTFGQLVMMHQTRTATPPRTFRPDIPEALGRVILRGLEVDPLLRQGSMAELKDALGAAV